MNTLRAFSRLIIGLTFIFSGFVKIIDPVGTGLIFSEYLRIIGITDIPLAAKAAGALLSVSELLIGSCVLLGVRMVSASKAALVFIALFTLITLYLAIFNPIHDCGCFGEALRLTNWQTFLKNIVLLALAIVIYTQIDSFVPVAPKWLERIFALLFLLFGIILSIYSFISLPMIDFTRYRTGTDLRELTGRENINQEPRFETRLIYKKGDTVREFSIDSLPDSTWVFEDSRTKVLSEKALSSGSQLEISDKEGNYVTDSLLFSTGRLFITTIPKLSQNIDKRINKSLRLRQELLSRGENHILLTGSSPAEADSLLVPLFRDHVQVYYADIKNVITINRSTAGIVYINNGVISAKWSRAQTPSDELDKILAEDPDYLAARMRLKGRITAEFTLLAFIALIMIMRYLCRSLYKHKPDKKDDDN